MNFTFEFTSKTLLKVVTVRLRFEEFGEDFAALIDFLDNDGNEQIKVVGINLFQALSLAGELIRRKLEDISSDFKFNGVPLCMFFPKVYPLEYGEDFILKLENIISNEVYKKRLSRYNSATGELKPPHPDKY